MEIIELNTLGDQEYRQALNCIRRSVETSNAPDYPPAVIEYQLRDHYTWAWITAKAQSTYFLVALIDDRVVGSGLLDGNEIKAVFVDPTYQRRGVGRALMVALELYGRRQGLQEIALKASITGLAFYTALQYRLVRELREEFQGDTIITYFMEKRLNSKR
jgi:GNAT superfamily N-acetyltransferase